MALIVQWPFGHDCRGSCRLRLGLCHATLGHIATSAGVGRLERTFPSLPSRRNVRRKVEDVDGVLGIGFNYEDHPDLVQFSLLEQMSNKNMIDSKMFNIKFKNEYKGTISFGDLITEEITDLYNGTCQPYKIEEGTEIAK